MDSSEGIKWYVDVLDELFGLDIAHTVDTGNTVTAYQSQSQYSLNTVSYHF